MGATARVGKTLVVNLPNADITLIGAPALSEYSKDVQRLLTVENDSPVRFSRTWFRRNLKICWANKSRGGGNVTVSDTGNAYASNGGVVNTGVSDGSSPNDGPVTITVPLHVRKIRIKAAATFGSTHTVMADVFDRR